MVRLRQLLDQARHRLSYIPLAFIALAIGLTQVTLRLDAQFEGTDLPELMRTTVDSARSILSAIAGGLISSVTLLLSLMLVAVQLASSQFSPRTLRNWVGDRTQQVAIGIVLGTVVYCLLILRETRTLSEGDALTPHLSVIVAVLLGIVSLIAVLRSVDHLTDRLRVGSVAASIMEDTIAMVERVDRVATVEDPMMVPASKPDRSALPRTRPDDAAAITAPTEGWVQQIDESQLLAATPDASTIYVTTAVGSFVFPDAPVAWIWPAPENPDAYADGIRAAFALGDTRTMQQDIGFGILQMVDIALRALSPGVNDPNTANDMIVHIGVVLLRLWERPMAPAIRDVDGKTIVRFDLEHGDFLHAAIDPIRHYGASDPNVAATMIRTLATVRSETQRRGLAGPVEPIEEAIGQVVAAVDRSGMSADDKGHVRASIPPDLSYG